MSKGLKILVWGVVLAACAGAGAFVASRSDPFPPGVEDPGARPSGSASPSETSGPTPEPEPADVTVRLRVDSEHELHVGGSCLSTWSGVVPLRFTDGDHLRGEGDVVLGTAGCQFDTAQVQTVLLVVRAVGRLEDDVLRLRFEEVSIAPAGSQDLGGFVATLDVIRPSIGLTGGRGAGTVRVTRPDGDLGRYVSVTRLHATCRGC